LFAPIISVRNHLSEFMNLSPIVIITTIVLSILGSSQVFAQTPISDLEIFQSCLNQAPIGQCANSDFNNDGLINVTDFSIFSSSFRGNFNDDSIIDLREIEANLDLGFLIMCIEQITPATQCDRTDLNNDGITDNLDLDEFRGLIIFDLNNDNIIDIQIYTSPVFQYNSEKRAKEGRKVAFYIYASNPQESDITYTVINAPENASYTPVVMGDVNSDDIVDDQDVDLLMLSIDNYYEQRFDLNDDNQINETDIRILKSLLGKTRKALVFEWTPGVNQSGLYDLLIDAEEVNGLISQAVVKMTIFDVEAFDSYYSYDDVLLIVNDQSQASQLIGDYFSINRGISSNRIVTISTPENETITRQIFEQDIRLPIEAYIKNNQLDSVINYIVTTKGVPLRISSDKVAADHASVDSELSMIAGPFADKIGAENSILNPYFDFDYPFSREMFGIFLVTRLTGYNVNDVFTLIDRSAQPEQYGTYILDVDPTKDADVGFIVANTWLRSAADILKKAGQFVLLDETTTFLTQQTHVLGYASWGSNDSNDTDNAKPKFNWLPGSIAETFVSTSARTFTSPAVYGQSLVADLIAEGVTGAKGYVYEPFLSAMARPYILFDRHAKGYALADTYFSASRRLGWQGVVIGDPKMAINNNIQLRKESDDEDEDDEHDDGHEDESDEDKQDVDERDDDEESNKDLDAESAADITTQEESSGSGSVGPWVFYLLLFVFLNRLIGKRNGF